VLVGLPCYSLWILARMIGSKESADVLGGHLGLVVELGKVPKIGVDDGKPEQPESRGQERKAGGARHVDPRPEPECDLAPALTVSLGYAPPESCVFASSATSRALGPGGTEV
jgi:hypothetical protein